MPSSMTLIPHHPLLCTSTSKSTQPSKHVAKLPFHASSHRRIIQHSLFLSPRSHPISQPSRLPGLKTSGPQTPPEKNAPPYSPHLETIHHRRRLRGRLRRRPVAEPGRARAAICAQGTGRVDGRGGRAEMEFDLAGGVRRGLHAGIVYV